MSLEIRVSSMPRPLTPRPSEFTQPFWAALDAGRFLTTMCTACRRISFPPREFCTACAEAQPEWVELSGHGCLYSSTRVHAAGGRFAWMAPYSIGIVDLEEGPRLLTRLMPEASSLALDARIRLIVLRHADGPLFAATAK
jgi:uncharacterized OB-fold protein